MIINHEVDGVRVSVKEARKAFIYVYKARKSFSSEEEVKRAFDNFISNRRKEDETKND